MPGKEGHGGLYRGTWSSLGQLRTSLRKWHLSRDLREAWCKINEEGECVFQAKEIPCAMWFQFKTLLPLFQNCCRSLNPFVCHCLPLIPPPSPLLTVKPNQTAHSSLSTLYFPTCSPFLWLEWLPVGSRTSPSFSYHLTHEVFPCKPVTRKRSLCLMPVTLDLTFPKVSFVTSAYIHTLSLQETVTSFKGRSGSDGLPFLTGFCSEEVALHDSRGHHWPQCLDTRICYSLPPFLLFS